MKNKQTANHQELVRRHYLKLMGIQNWQPKFTFANAKVARDLSNLSAITPELCLATQTNNRSRQQQITKANNQTINSKPIINQADIKAKPDISVDINLVKKIAKPTFSTTKTTTIALKQNKSINQNNKIYNLLVWNPKNDYLIISDIGDSKSNLPLYQSKGLLSKILKALRIEPAIDKLPREFIWPPSNLGVFKELYYDINSATEAFLAFLNYQFDYKKQNNILVFGSNAAKVTIGKGKGISLTRGIQQCSITNKIYAITYSLSNIIANPSLKPAVWQDIFRLTAMD